MSAEHPQRERRALARLPRERRTFSLTAPAIEVLETFAQAADMNLSQWLSRRLVAWGQEMAQQPAKPTNPTSPAPAVARAPGRHTTGSSMVEPGPEYVEVVVEARDVGKQAWMRAAEAGVGP